MSCFLIWSVENVESTIMHGVVLTCTRDVCYATFTLLFDDAYNCCLPNIKPKKDFSSMHIVCCKIEFIPPGLRPLLPGG